MAITTDQLQEILNATEGEHCEFKEAKSNYNFNKLVQYCSALANEGGGMMVLGVTDKRPRKVAGTQAFSQPEQTRSRLIGKLSLNITFSLLRHPIGPVLIFHIPSRPVDMPVKADGIYWERRSDSLVHMSENRLREIFAEGGRDFSAEICNGATMADLDEGAIENFRQRWVKKSNNKSLLTLSREQLLSDAEALIDGKPTYASLVLFGTRQALGKHLSLAEVVFEYRSSHASGPAQQREEFRQGFFAYYDKLWQLINLRNDIQHFQSGLFLLDIPTFSERTVREALLNAISHRNYQLGGSVFIRQYPRKLVLESPGGFPVGVTVENILDRQSPRNRRIADIFAKCGLVERSGQGMNLMFERSIQESKSAPDFSGTDQYQVVLRLNGEVEDPRFLEFLEKIGREKLELFDTADFLLLDMIHREQRVPDTLKDRFQSLVDKGIIEKFGRGRGVKYILCRRYYQMVDNKGMYTRKKGLDRDTNKALLLKHIKENTKKGSPLRELMQVLPALSKDQIQNLLRELKAEEQIVKYGTTRAAMWYSKKN